MNVTTSFVLSSKLSRWLAGRGIPDFVEINDARIVAPPSNLAAVKREIDYFETRCPIVCTARRSSR